MKKILFWISCALMLVFWPISFGLANGQDWLVFFVATIIIALSWIFYLLNIKYHYFLYLAFPLIHPAYLAISFLGPLAFLKGSKKIALIVYACILLFLTFNSWKTFYAYSIFTPDPLAFDTLTKKITLIPNRNLARIFENKTTIFQDKFKDNSFMFFDINNYFFSLHPREKGDGQNLNKYPYLAIIPFLFGLYLLVTNKHRVWISATFLSAVFSLSLINNPDRFDLLIYIPISLLCFYGLKKFYSNSGWQFWVFTCIFIPVSSIEIIRILALS